MGKRPETFDEQDEFSPVYCARCRRQVPHTLLEEYPYCPACLAAVAEENRARAQAQQLAAQAELQRQEEARQRLYHTDTGLGGCPQCGSRNLTRITQREADTGAQATAACLGCFLFWPLLLVIPFMRRTVGWHHRCNYCGNMWQV
jgi:DNA-directed RNA polymerase subunit RPC12/RpoP